MIHMHLISLMKIPFDTCTRSCYHTPVNYRTLKALERFQTQKSLNPRSTYGATDRPFQGPEFTGLDHAHLTHDISLIYRYVGTLNQFKLYGFYSHDDLGTGTPPNTLKQSAVGGRLRSQVFENQ